VGAEVGASVGALLGTGLGTVVGILLGELVGEAVGTALGKAQPSLLHRSSSPERERRAVVTQVPHVPSICTKGLQH
jgi:phage tail tape-measure protein